MLKSGEKKWKIIKNLKKCKKHEVEREFRKF